MKIYINHFHPDVPTRVLRAIEFFYAEEPDGDYKIQLTTNETRRCNCVAIPITDSRVYWGYRGHRHLISPLISVESLSKEELVYTNQITVCFRKKGDKINIGTAFWGSGDAPREPQRDLPNLEESIEFWSTHALIPDEPIRISTNRPFWAK